MNNRTRFYTIAAIAALTVSCSNSSEEGRGIHASGHIEATEVRLSSKHGGRLLEAPFEEGATVTAGEMVARFETIDDEHRLAQARAQVAAADALTQIRRIAGRRG